MIELLEETWNLSMRHVPGSPLAPRTSWKMWASTNTTTASSCCMNQGERPASHGRAISKREGASLSFLWRIPSPRMVYVSYRQSVDRFTCTVFLDRDNSFQDFRFLILSQLKEIMCWHLRPLSEASSR